VDPDSDPDADPNPAIFVIDLQDANQKLILKNVFLLFTVLFEGTVPVHQQYSTISSVTVPA
jgi:hypothetical protein